MRYTLQDSITIARSAASVYAVISDITRTGEWSVQTHLCEWDGPERGVGATFAGHNRTPDREWTTVSRVVVDEPGVEFGWAIVASDVRWGYRLEAVDYTSSILTEYTAFGETAETVFVERFGADAVHQTTIRLTAAATGIPVTLARIKEIVESD